MEAAAPSALRWIRSRLACKMRAKWAPGRGLCLPECIICTAHHALLVDFKIFMRKLLLSLADCILCTERIVVFQQHCSALYLRRHENYQANSLSPLFLEIQICTITFESGVSQLVNILIIFSFDVFRCFFLLLFFACLFACSFVCFLACLFVCFSSFDHLHKFT